MESIHLLPAPRQIIRTPGTYTLTAGKLILIDNSSPQDFYFISMRFKQALIASTNLDWDIVASPLASAGSVGLVLRLNSQSTSHPQGYHLEVTPEGIFIEAHDLPGLFYGVCTLIQLVQSCSLHPYDVPCIQITDYPDFANRGVMLDISRDKVPTVATLLDLIDRLASWKINQLQLYIEHTFAYRQHPEVWADASPFTGEEILLVDAYCRERFIDFVPNQNSFGHLHRWLSLPRYRHLAEAPHGFTFPWGSVSKEPFSLCPLDPGSIDFIRSLYAEFLPYFTSHMFNVGCDETFDLGQGRSQQICEQRGKGQVYLDFLLQIYKEVTSQGRKMQFWGDIINQHPELVSSLPKDCIALEWGYEASHPFESNCSKFAQAGLEFYVCPGTSSWNSITGRTDNALGNLVSAAVNGLKFGASGYLITDWGDNGHWQTLPVSYLGFLAGAAYSWCLDQNCTINLPDALDIFAFDDPSSSLGAVAYNLGNIYRTVGIEPENSSALFWLLQHPLTQPPESISTIPADAFYRTLDAINKAVSPLVSAQSKRSDGELLTAEFALCARMLQHAVHRGLLIAGDESMKKQALNRDLAEIINEYQRIWLTRNRPGGLKESLARLECARSDYVI